MSERHFTEFVCKGCGKGFRSRRKKIYCSLSCYLKDPETKARLRENGLRASIKKHGPGAGTMIEFTCAECGTTHKIRFRRRKRRFCNSGCYRAFMSKRFDRFIANPETIALPQCYDEFLDRDVLKCPFENCEWEGKFLSCHVNFAHGVTAEQFKEMAGFNKHTGVISKDLAEKLRGRAVNISGFAHRDFEPGPARQDSSSVRNLSLEGREHLRKSRALNTEIEDGLRKWKEDNPDWKERLAAQRKREAETQSGPYERISVSCFVCGSAMEAPKGCHPSVHICSDNCRREHHNRKFVKAKSWSCQCFQCGQSFLGSYVQHKSFKKGGRVYCGRDCLNARRSVIGVPPGQSS